MIIVAAAIIENEQGQLLIARRGKGRAQEGLWEFPGGKLEQDETFEQCLKRELLEEMSIEIEVGESFGVNDHYYGTTHIRLYAYRASFISGDVVLVDHDQAEWVYPSQIAAYEFAPADLPFVEKLLEDL